MMDKLVGDKLVLCESYVGTTTYSTVSVVRVTAQTIVVRNHRGAVHRARRKDGVVMGSTAYGPSLKLVALDDPAARLGMKRQRRAHIERQVVEAMSRARTSRKPGDVSKAVSLVHEWEAMFDDDYS